MHYSKTAERYDRLILMLTMVSAMCIIMMAIIIYMTSTVTALQNRVDELSQRAISTNMPATSLELTQVSAVQTNAVMLKPVALDASEAFSNTEMELESQFLEAQESYEDTMVTKMVENATPMVYSDVFIPCGLTADQINQVILDTCAYYGIDSEKFALTGMGESLYEEEQTYGVNALAILAIAQGESGLNTSSIARSTNNVTSISNGSGSLVHYESYSECIMNTGRLLKDKYHDQFGYETLAGIGQTYCPYNSEWGSIVSGYMNTIVSLAT